MPTSCTRRCLDAAVVATVALTIAAAALAQAPGASAGGKRPSRQPEKGARPVVKMPPLLKPMFVDKALFKPDKWWEYEEPEEERPRAFSVEQKGKVAIGGRLEQNRGCLVRYRVATCDSPEKAHQYLKAVTPEAPGPPTERRVARKLKEGDEGVEVTSRRIGPKGEVVEFGRERVVRYGRYVVMVYSRSDMKAFGPVPPSGERRWMADAVYDAVVRAVSARWAKYPSLLAGVK